MNKTRCSVSPRGHIRFMVPLLDPEFLPLRKHGAVVIADSGRIQEETTFLCVPCLTVRENTERPVTTTIGTHVPAGRDTALLTSEFARVLSHERMNTGVPPRWDDRAAERIAKVIVGK
jgi:UDP-N-acetylglucosamine 2-epimerase (non-hydrolysing)